MCDLDEPRGSEISSNERMLNTTCISDFSAAVTKCRDPTQHKEETVYFDVPFQRARVLHDREGEGMAPWSAGSYIFICTWEAKSKSRKWSKAIKLQRPPARLHPPNVLSARDRVFRYTNHVRKRCSFKPPHYSRVPHLLAFYGCALPIRILKTKRWVFPFICRGINERKKAQIKTIFL